MFMFLFVVCFTAGITQKTASTLGKFTTNKTTFLINVRYRYIKCYKFLVCCVRPTSMSLWNELQSQSCHPLSRLLYPPNLIFLPSSNTREHNHQHRTSPPCHFPAKGIYLQLWFISSLLCVFSYREIVDHPYITEIPANSFRGITNDVLTVWDIRTPAQAAACRYVHVQKGNIIHLHTWCRKGTTSRWILYYKNCCNFITLLF